METFVLLDDLLQHWSKYRPGVSKDFTQFFFPDRFLFDKIIVLSE